VSGIRVLAFLGLLLIACWRSDDRLLPAVFLLFALAILDRRGPAVAAAVIFATLLYHWEPAAIALGVFGYAFFFYALIGLRAKRAAIIGFGFGTGLAALNLRWLVAEFDTQWAGLVLFIVSVYGGIFMATVAALLRCSLVRRPGLLGLILTALTLPAADYLRVIAPRFGIGNLHSAHLPVANLDLAQAAHWAGAAGLSALMAFCSYAAANWLFHERRSRWLPRIAARRTARVRLGLALGLVILTIGIGRLDRYYSSHVPDSPLKVAVVQSGLPSEANNAQEIPPPPNRAAPHPPHNTETAKEGLPSNPGSTQSLSSSPTTPDSAPSPVTETTREEPPSATESYAASLKSYLVSGDPGDILFLPEGAISLGEWNDPDDPNVEPLMSLSDLKEKFGAKIDSFLVTGAMIKERDGKKLSFRNTAISLDRSFNLLGQVDKQFGAPLVEVNPFRGIPVLDEIGERATHLSRRMQPQWNSAVLPIGLGLQSIVAICNEHQLPDIWRQRGVHDLTRINLQLVLSDVSWFDNSEEERTQSRLARRLLAVKYRRPLLYVANNGSEFWDSNGRLVYSLGPSTQFAVWKLAIPQLSTTSSWSWQPPPEFWPLPLFCVLFACRFFLSRFRPRTKR
jgi:apolipoprotein N-acyltransferase